MAKKAKKDNKNLIIGICCGIAALVVVVVIAIVLVVSNNNTLSDDYFQSDDTKYVLTVDADVLDIESDDETPTPVKTHLVYTYSGDEITGLKTYAEYANADDAKAAFDAMQAAGSEEDIELNGKYIIATNDAEAYEGLTASDIEQQIQFMEALKNMNLNDVSDDVDDTTETEETEKVEEDQPQQ